MLTSTEFLAMIEEKRQKKQVELEEKEKRKEEREKKKKDREEMLKKKKEEREEMLKKKREEREKQKKRKAGPAANRWGGLVACLLCSRLPAYKGWWFVSRTDD